MTPSPSTVAVIGAGPAGLMAAERLAQASLRVVVHERMPSVARKFLMAGRGGLNLTHSEPPAPFLNRYDAAAQGRIKSWLDAFSPADLIEWVEGLGQPTFVGSSGRVFPKAMKASPLLRAWLAWQGEALTFDTPEGERIERADAVVLALGGASWAKLGSDAAWVPALEEAGAEVADFRPTNVGFDVSWSPLFRERFAGTPLKGIALTDGGRTVRGEAMIAAYGIEGGGIYALSAALREAVERDGSTTLTLDLRPDLSVEALTQRLSKPRGKDSLSNWLRKAARLDATAVALLREGGSLPADPTELAARIKGVALTLTGVQGLARAISSAGGVALDAVDERLMLKARPGVFVAGEMLDWEAPTGGYLLQASFASGVVAAEGVRVRLDGR